MLTVSVSVRYTTQGQPVNSPTLNRAAVSHTDIAGQYLQDIQAAVARHGRWPMLEELVQVKALTGQ